MLDQLTDFLQQHLAFTLVFSSILGLLVGSFINVVIYRLPIMLEKDWRQQCHDFLNLPNSSTIEKFNLLLPSSHCTQCKKPIKSWQNIPLCSYLFLRGKSACCRQKISCQYPLVELLAGILSLVATWHFNVSPITFAVYLLLWGSLALIFIDLKHQILPDVIVLPLLWLGLLFNIDNFFVPLADAVIGAVAGYLSLWLVTWLYKIITGKVGMGNGDFKFLAMFGAWLGWKMLPLIIFSSAIMGMIIGLSIMAIKKQHTSIPIPFGPYLALGGLIALLWGSQLMQCYFQFVML